MLDWIADHVTREILGIAVQKYLLAFVMLFAALLFRKILQGFLEKRLAKAAERTKTRLDDLLLEAVGKPMGLAVLLAGILLALLVLGLPEDISRIVKDIFKVLFAAIGVWFVFRIVDVIAEFFARRAQKTESKLDDQLVPLVRKAGKVFFGVVAFVLIIQNMGYSVSGLLAGLGLGGLAFALAAKDTIANLFGSATIFADRPFRIGDRIQTGDTDGVVEQVGFRSTKIRTFEKTLVTIPNNTLANSTIDNLSARQVRRVKMTVGLTYETTAGQMEKALDTVGKILRGHEGIDPEGINVYFTDFAESSLDILVIYFTKSTDWDEYCRVRQEVNLSIMRALEGLGLSIAFPSTTVYLRKDG